MLGPALQRAGLTARALAAWAGTDRVAALPLRVNAMTARDPVPAAVALAVFVAGVELAVDRCRLLPLAELLERDLVERTGDRIRARVAIVPLARSLLVCDRRDARDHEQLVAWPDDSSHHLAGAIPAGRRAAWLDLGCGSAFAQLARPELATALHGIDRNPRAVEFARLGAELSGLALTCSEADVAAAHGSAELVTCNAPIPGSSARAIWRRAGEPFFTELWPAIRRCLAPGGMAIVHAARRAIPDELPGERVIVAYADEFAVLWWRPDAPARFASVELVLTRDRPHVDARDRDDALATC
jgi:SAM-dependent methyltransferase